MSTDSHDRAKINKAIGNRVAWCMRYDGPTRRTQAELAELLNIEQSGVSKKVTGARPFYPDELYAIAAWLDRPFTDLMPTDEQFATPPAPRYRPDPTQGDPGVTRQYRSSTLLPAPSPKVTRTTIAA